jgi:hypothetical protein
VRRAARGGAAPPAAATNQALVAAGLAEVALGAATGWPFALAIADPDRARSLGVRSVARLRQWHLDLVALGGLTVLAATAVPDLPRRVAVPLGVGAWANANAFGVLVFRPEARDHPAYRAAVGASFAATTWGFGGLALTALRAYGHRRKGASARR